ncbi:MAG TPA: exosortase J [Terracidiphilus sp.]|nr:exosortase J [Terracidiphilus sp.]
MAEALATTQTETGSEPQLHLVKPASPSIALWCAIVILAAAGCVGIERELALLWRCWTTDPLRSIGMLIPPASIILTLRVWRKNGWQLRGSWLGLVLIAAAFSVSILRHSAEVFIAAGGTLISLIPLTSPVYLYGSGVVLLFAGPRVWRKAWFPLALLLLSQPVPVLTSSMIDIPLQNVSARVARDFATLIHFAPTTPQLRLMFSPDFGMFIAPGCDGIRGAVALGYLALILGYLKRVSFRRWAAYVAGGVLLGYFFNFIRLCVLVVYYRVALGHSALEGVAKQADYVIGSCLFLIAILIFVRLATLSEKSALPSDSEPTPAAGSASPVSSRENSAPSSRHLFIRCAAFAGVLVAFLALPSSALRSRPSPQASMASAAALARFPQQIGSFALSRTWYEQSGGQTLVDSAAYSAPGSDEIILAVWVAPFVYYHDANSCWLARGLTPERLASIPYLAARGSALNLSTGFYDDGVADSIVVSVACTPGSCSQSQPGASNSRIRLVVLKPQTSDLTGGAAHPVPIMIRIDRPHSAEPSDTTQAELTAEARAFISGLDPMSLSRAFQ